MTQKETYELTNKLIEDIAKLLKIYLINMGVDIIPEIYLKPAINWKNKLEVREIIECANTTINLGIYPKGIKTKSRRRDLVQKRQIACYIARKMGYTCEVVGKCFGIDHATVIHGCKVVDQLLDVVDPELKKAYDEILIAVNTYYKEKYGKDLSAIDN
jgi:chromosomal replication initiation ATPase DnaA